MSSIRKDWEKNFKLNKNNIPGWIIDRLGKNFMHDGNDDDLLNSGATSIFKDNSFSKPIITPKTMKNSVLIYKSSEKLFHGFDFTKLPKNSYRKTVNFLFFPK